MPISCKFDSIRRTQRVLTYAANMRFVSLIAATLIILAFAGTSYAECLRLIDGTVIKADDAWEDTQGIWYRQGGLTRLIERSRVRAIECNASAKETNAAKQKAELKTGVQAKIDIAKDAQPVSAVREATPATALTSITLQPIWIYLVGGARIEADEVTETAAGAWSRRGNLSIFFERARIERIERETRTQPSISDTSARTQWRARGWSTGNARLDDLIKSNGARQGVDPYLIFCVMEQESHFNARAVSPVGARGLMQLMPGTGARFGVRRFFDPAENVAGGTRYLKQLLQQFGGRVDLVLAGYNAGEGAVIKYGGRVPPYRETRNYVQRISARYKQNDPVRQERAAHESATRGAGISTAKTQQPIAIIATAAKPLP